MGKREWEQAAILIRDVPEMVETRTLLANFMAVFFKRDNDKFDDVRFFLLCGLAYADTGIRAKVIEES